MRWPDCGEDYSFPMTAVARIPKIKRISYSNLLRRYLYQPGILNRVFFRVSSQPLVLTPATVAYLHDLILTY
jgi:hypothetical protein